MKHLIYLFSALLLTSFSVNADDTNNLNTFDTNTIIPSYRGYGNSFIFNEQGIEFSVYADGQFDFYMPNYGPRRNINFGARNTNVSFNSGYDYSSYIQYDDFGAIVQIENTPVFYDAFGRISQAGNVRITYNRRGFVSRVGGLFVHYNRFNAFDYSSGFINIYNRAYVYRPWHRFYTVPAFNHCVVFNSPYRQNYAAIRYRYDRPYRNNFRRSTAVANRRGNIIKRNRKYASRTKGRTRIASSPKTRTHRNDVATSRKGTRGNNASSPQRIRRNSKAASRTVTRNSSNASKIRSRGNSKATPRTRSRGNNVAATPKTRTRSNVKTRTSSRINTSSPNNRVRSTSTPARTRKSSVNTSRTRTNKTVQRSAPRSQRRVATASRKTQSRALNPASRTKRSTSRSKFNRR